MIQSLIINENGQIDSIVMNRMFKHLISQFPLIWSNGLSFKSNNSIHFEIPQITQDKMNIQSFNHNQITTNINQIIQQYKKLHPTQPNKSNHNNDWKSINEFINQSIENRTNECSQWFHKYTSELIESTQFIDEIKSFESRFDEIVKKIAKGHRICMRKCNECELICCKIENHEEKCDCQTNHKCDEKCDTGDGMQCKNKVGHQGYFFISFQSNYLK